MDNTFQRTEIDSKTISIKGHFKVSLVEISKNKYNICCEAIGNPPQGEIIEMQSSFPKDEPWKHTVWVRHDMHEEFIKAYLDMVKSAGWKLPNHELITQLIESGDLGDQKFDIEQVIKNPDKARQIIARIGSIRDNQTRDFRNDLEKFKELLDQRSDETKIHQFLKERPWIFGIDYISEATKDKFEVQFGEFDFLLERFNKVYDIVELKGINASVFEEYRSGRTKQGTRTRWQLSKDLSGAIMQVTDYFSEFEKARSDEDVRIKRGLQDYRKPRGQIIIGHRDDFIDDQERYLNELNYRLNNIDILTFSDLYDRAVYFVEILESSIIETKDSYSEIRPEDLHF